MGIELTPEVWTAERFRRSEIGRMKFEGTYLASDAKSVRSSFVRAIVMSSAKPTKRLGVSSIEDSFEIWCSERCVVKPIYRVLRTQNKKKRTERKEKIDGRGLILVISGGDASPNKWPVPKSKKCGYVIVLFCFS